MHWSHYAAIILVAVIHAFFGYKEFFQWPAATKMLLGIEDKDFVDQSAVLGQNFAVYNWMIAIGLVGALLLGEKGLDVQIWLLASIAVVGAFGGWSTGWILYAAQCAPAILALALLLLVKASPSVT